MYVARLGLLLAFAAAVRPAGATTIYPGAEDDTVSTVPQPRMTPAVLRSYSVTPAPDGLPDERAPLPILAASYQRKSRQEDEPWGPYRAYAHWPSLVLALIALAAVAFAWKGERDDEEPGPRRLRRVYVVR